MAKAGATSTDTKTFESPIPDAALPVLHALVVATKVPGFLWMPEDEANALVSVNFAEVHPTAKDGAAVAAMATALGIDYADKNPAVAAEGYEAGTGDPLAVLAKEDESKPKPQAARTDTGFKRPSSFEVDDGVALPPATRGGAGGESVSAYPFDKLNVGQSFHIAATEKNKDPAKSVASSVSTATKRYTKEVIGEDGKPVMHTVEYTHRGVKKSKTEAKRTDPERVFTVRSVGTDDPKGAGCRVWRTK